MSSKSRHPRSRSPRSSVSSASTDSTRSPNSSHGGAPPGILDYDFRQSPPGLGICDVDASEQHQDRLRGNSSEFRRVSHTGGFLLDETTPIVNRNAEQNRALPSSKINKGKEVGGKSQRSSMPGGHVTPEHKRISTGKSHLAFELSSTPHHNEHQHGDSPTDAPTASINARRSSVDGASARTSSGGLDVDATQIIRLALSLGENRRRQISLGHTVATDGASFLIPRTHYTVSHLTGPVAERAVHSRSPTPALKQHGSPKPPSPRPKGDYPHASWLGPASNVKSPVVPIGELNSVNDVALVPSSATQGRVAKAKHYFELASLNRHLQQQLPPLPSPRTSRPRTAINGRNESSEPEMRLGRAFNPLQYIRNRRTRALSHRMLDSEAAGWDDVEKVREWLSRLEEARRAQAGEAATPFMPRWHIPNSPTQNGAAVGEPQVAKSQAIPRASRSRLNWSVMPWDMLADTYWTEQDDHKWLIEDRKGRRVFGSKPSSAQKVSGYSKGEATSIQRREGALQLVAIEPSHAREEHVSDVAALRGRHLLRAQRSILSAGENSSSQDRKRKWPRPLIRSRSSSSSEASKSGSTPPQKCLRPRLNSQDQQDSMILEKQVNKILATQESANGLNGFESTVIDSIEDASKSPLAPSPVIASRKNNANGDAADSPEAALRTPPRGQIPAHGNSFHRSQSSLESAFSTVPNSPDSRLSIPSIAINLSPPKGRKLSKILASNALHRLSILDQRANLTSSEDPEDAQAQAQLDGSLDDRGRGKDASNSDRLLSPKSAERASRLRRRRSESRSLRSKKMSGDALNRAKGAAMPSRIVDFVSNPVHRVGDLMRRKEAIEQASRPSESHSQRAESLESSTDGREMVHMPSRNDVPSSGGHNATAPSAGHKYHFSNLPTFKATSQADFGGRTTSRERVAEESQRRVSEDSGRFNRFRRFGSMDADAYTSSSRSPSARPSVKSSHEESKDSHTTDRGPRSRRFAIVGSSPDPQGFTHAVTGSHNPNTLTFSPEDGPGMADLKVWSKLQSSPDHVAGGDVARLKALMLVAGVLSGAAVDVSANVNDQSREPALPLRSSFQIAEAEAPHVRETNEAVRDAADRLSNQTMNDLHEQIRELDSRISSTLTQQVRQLVDDADMLGARLGTSCTLEVKRLNDRIDQIMRRRRRRLRWLRRTGYLALEWTLLATMWWVWLVVVIFRLTRGLVRGVFHSVRWVLWL